MASGDTLMVLTPRAFTPPSSNPATLDSFAGGSNNTWPVLDFPDGSTEHSADWIFVMPRSYTGDGAGGSSGMTVSVYWSSNTAAAEDVVWSGAFMSVTADADDLDTKTLAAQNDSSPDQTASAEGEITVTTITFADSAADTQALLPGEMCLFRLTRSSADANDTLTDDAEVHLVEIRET